MAWEKSMQTVSAIPATGQTNKPPRLAETGSRSPRAQRLARAIETEIVPRLLLARPALPPVAPPSASDVAVLADLALRDDAAALAFVEQRHADGIPLDAVYIDLLAPAARQLGALWEDDAADFTQVTLGVWRLQRVLHEMAPAFRPEALRRDRRRRILLAPVPGEQHVFAVALLAELFRRAGWEVEAPLDATADDLNRLVAHQRFTVLGLSLGGEDQLDGLAGLIRGLRRASVHRGIGVMVGGPVFLAHPDYVTLVGADATASDARQAITQAEALLGLLAAKPA